MQVKEGGEKNQPYTIPIQCSKDVRGCTEISNCSDVWYISCNPPASIMRARQAVFTKVKYHTRKPYLHYFVFTSQMNQIVNYVTR